MSKQKKITITPKKLHEIQHDAVMRTVVLMCACLMDEFGYKKDDLHALSVRFERYSAAEKEHLITIKQVKEIMNEEMGYNDDRESD